MHVKYKYVIITMGFIIKLIEGWPAKKQMVNKIAKKKKKGKKTNTSSCQIFMSYHQIVRKCEQKDPNLSM